MNCPQRFKVIEAKSPAELETLVNEWMEKADKDRNIMSVTDIKVTAMPDMRLVASIVYYRSPRDES